VFLTWFAAYKPFKDSWRNHMEVINILTVIACFMCVFPFVSYELSDDEFSYVAITAASIILFLILLNVVIMSTYLLIHQCKA